MEDIPILTKLLLLILPLLIVGAACQKQEELSRHKLISTDAGRIFEPYDLVTDWEEKRDITEELPNLAETMKEELLQWQASCEKSSMEIDQ